MATGMPGLPNEPFLWGKGGKRMTPEDIALQRRLAAQQLATGADYSPVQHWAQGLARVANGVAGGLQMRGANRAADANAEESNAVLQALMAGGQPAEGAPDPVLAALTNPNVSDQVRDVATMMFRERNEAPPTPYRQEDNAGNVWEMGPDGQFKRIFTDLAPKQFIQDGQLVTVPNPYGGGTSAPAGPVAPPPEAIAELRADPSAAAEFDQVFGPGASQRILGAEGGPVSAPGNFPDRQP